MSDHPDVPVLSREEIDEMQRGLGPERRFSGPFVNPGDVCFEDTVIQIGRLARRDSHGVVAMMTGDVLDDLLATAKQGAADRERLDWIEAELSRQDRSLDFCRDDEGTFVFALTDYSTGRAHEHRLGLGSSGRAAIDAARKEETP